MPELDYDAAAQTLVVRPDHDLHTRGAVILLHGATHRFVRFAAALAGMAPGVWSVGGTAYRLAMRGFEVFVPEADEGAGRRGAWLDRTLTWATAYEALAVVGFSFGGTSAMLLVPHLAKHRETSVVLLDPAVKNFTGAKAVARCASPTTTLFAAQSRTRGRDAFVGMRSATTCTVAGTRHRHFAQPLGYAGALYAVVDPGVNRAHRALERALGV